MIELKDLSKTYHSKKGTNCAAIRNISLTFEEKGMVFLTGKSGSGKSTLLNLIGGLDKFDSGTIKLYGNDCQDFSQNDFDDFRNNFVGFIFQDCSLIEDINVKENLEIVFSLQDKQASDEKIAQVLSEVGLEGYEQRNINELSGGQRQRIAIARALLKDPKILLADEPTGALDHETGQQIFRLFTELSKKILVIVVSHDAQNVFKYADRIIELKDGQIISDRQKCGDFNYDNLKQSFETEVDGYFHPTKEAVIPQKPLDFGGSKLALSQTIKTGLHNLFAKKFRLALTVFLSVVILALFGVLFSFSTYDKTASALKSFGRFDINTIELRNIDDENSVMGAIAHKDFEYEDYLKLAEDYENVQKTLYFDGRVGYYNPRFLTELNESSEEELARFYGTEVIEGSLPRHEYRTKTMTDSYGIEHDLMIVEVLISDYVADTLLERRIRFDNGMVSAHSARSQLVGKQTVLSGALIYEIAGIFSTDNDKFETDKQRDTTEYRFKRHLIYQTALTVKDAYFDAIMYAEAVSSPMTVTLGENTRSVGSNSAANGSGRKGLTQVYISRTTYSAVQGFDITKPLADNQAIIPLSFYNALAVSFDFPECEEVSEIGTAEFNRLKGLGLMYHTDKYAVDSFDVLAVFDDTKMQEEKWWVPEIIFNETNLSKCLRRLLLVPRMRLEITEDYRENELLLEDLATRNIDYNTYLTNDLRIYEQINYFLSDFLWAICLTVFVFAGLLFYSFISNNIGAKKKDIGILRAIGAKGKDISKIFFVEGLILGVANFIISCGLTVLGVFALNTSLTKFAEHKITVIRLNIWALVIILVLNFSIILVSGFLSVRHLTKQKPIDVIKNA